MRFQTIFCAFGCTYSMKTCEYNYFYKFTHIESGRYYMGVHSTDNLNDHYTGSGTIWKSIYKKYGRKNCIKEILQFFDSREEAIKHEELIIDDDLLKDSLCVNLNRGGCANNPPPRDKSKNPFFEKHHTEEARMKMSEIKRSVPEEDRKELARHARQFSSGNLEHHHSKEAKEKMRNAKLGKVAWNKGKKCPEISKRMIGNTNGKKK